MEYMYKSKLGGLLISYNDEFILSARFDQEQTQPYVPNSVIYACIKQLDLYFDAKLKQFDLPLDPKGTDFQKAVWNELEKIPIGQTKTYGEIATAIGNPKASRAVGGANNKNPIYLIIPCHRVVGAGGDMTGYGAGVKRKLALLELENNFNTKT